jgi:hypothetical protein
MCYCIAVAAAFLLFLQPGLSRLCRPGLMPAWASGALQDTFHYCCGATVLLFMQLAQAWEF